MLKYTTPYSQSPVVQHFILIPEGSTNTGSSQLSHICRIVPIVVVLCSVVIGSLIWAILDPTLEPHLRIVRTVEEHCANEFNTGSVRCEIYNFVITCVFQFNLDASEVGLIFLLMSACYAICSPLWGWVADKVVCTLGVKNGGVEMRA